MPMEYLKGTYCCDFCHRPSNKIAKLKLSGVIYTPCPTCLTYIEAALEEWYQWANLPADMLTREIGNARTLARKIILLTDEDE